MKAKVEQFANGIFEYETPQLLLSEEEIILTLDLGKSCVGEFVIKNTKNTVITGEVYSSNERIKLSQYQFSGTDNIIQYELKGEKLKDSDSIKSDIYIISDCGEARIPMYINVESPSLPSSMGKIKDLFNFTNLAKVDWSEAVRLFKTKEFRMLIKSQDEKILLQYDNLLKSRSGSGALEEFLKAIRKKLKINYIVDKNVLHYEVGSESFMDKVTLMKDNWGYEEIRVSTDAPFLSLEHKIIWSDYFVGNTYPLEFVIQPKYLRSGNNFGHIYLNSIHESIVVDVTCHYQVDHHRKPGRKDIKDKLIQLSNLYINFRKNVINLKDYGIRANKLLDLLMKTDQENHMAYQLMRLHLEIISGQESDIIMRLNTFKTDALNLTKEKELYVSACLYLTALVLKDEVSIQEALKSIKEYYLRSNDNWKLLWFLLYIDKKYDSNKVQKLSDMKEAYNQGCNSPIMYFEAVTILNEEPVLLHELSEYELQVLYWAITNDYCNEELARQFTYLVGKKKNFNRLYLEGLSALYDKFHTKDILTAICSLLIKGHKRNSKYFNWFLLGVKEQLRITELYEYYMYTLNEELGQEIPQPVLLYFIYNSNLSDRKKAYLYAYVIKNKEAIPSLYHTYYKKIEHLALKFLKDHVINRDLACIYEAVIKETGITPEIAKELPEVMFKYEIGCNNRNIKGVFIVYKELEGERYYPFINQTATIDIFTEDYELVFVDYYDYKYTKTIEYTLNKLMDYESFVKECVKFNSSPMLLLNLAGKALAYQKFDEESLIVRERLLAVKNLNTEYYNYILLDLLQYYYDNFRTDDMERYLDFIDIHLLKKEDRNKVIELYLIRDHYDKAVQAIKDFGYENIQLNKLFKLFTHLFTMNKDEKKDDLLVELAYHIFLQGKYNEEILLYLSKYYKGSTGEMYRIWEACTAFELDMLWLEERLLIQMLYTEDYIVNSFAVFLRYYQNGTNHKLIRAYLSYHAYKYLAMGRIIRTELFDIMKKELVYEENDICMMALLKKLSNEECYSEGEIEFIDMNVHRFMKMGIVLPFFKRFSDVVNIHTQISDRFFIEYITSTSNKVTLHYQMGDEMEDFKTEVMPNVFQGIHIKDFVLFYNENIRYYITEESDDGQVVITESVNVSLGQDMKLEEDTWYNQINFLLTALELKDDKTLLEGIDNFVTTKHLANELFKMI